MPRNFSTILSYEQRQLRAVFIPHSRKDGLYYEVNITGFPRFSMGWSQLGRYDIVKAHQSLIPYPLVLAASDAIEKLAS